MQANTFVFSRIRRSTEVRNRMKGKDRHETNKSE